MLESRYQLSVGTFARCCCRWQPPGWLSALAATSDGCDVGHAKKRIAGPTTRSCTLQSFSLHFNKPFHNTLQTLCITFRIISLSKPNIHNSAIDRIMSVSVSVSPEPNDQAHWTRDPKYLRVPLPDASPQAVREFIAAFYVQEGGCDPQEALHYASLFRMNGYAMYNEDLEIFRDVHRNGKALYDFIHRSPHGKVSLIIP